MASAPRSGQARSRSHSVVVEVPTSVAPDIEADQIDPDVNFRDQFDFDSMDFLNFAIGLHERLALDIPETDYPRLSNLGGCVA